MSRSTRHKALQKLDNCAGNLETCRGHLKWLIDTYLEDHVELAAPLISVYEVCEELEKTLRRSREGF